jgi:hypothetical protein
VTTASSPNGFLHQSYDPFAGDLHSDTSVPVEALNGFGYPLSPFKTNNGMNAAD